MGRVGDTLLHWTNSSTPLTAVGGLYSERHWFFKCVYLNANPSASALADSLTSTTHIKDGPSGAPFSPQQRTTKPSNTWALLQSLQFQYLEKVNHTSHALNRSIHSHYLCLNEIQSFFPRWSRREAEEYQTPVKALCCMAGTEGRDTNCSHNCCNPDSWKDTLFFFLF